MVAGVALVRLFPQRWPSLLGGVVLASVVVCGYALLTKVFPGSLNPDEIYARLREPFGYWNAVGLMAAAAGPACLWLGARRSGHAAVSALAYPALGLLIVALLLAYSRGALLALAVGCALWFAVVPLRLRGVAVLATSAFCGGLVAFWAFASNPLSTDNVAAGRARVGRPRARHRPGRHGPRPARRRPGASASPAPSARPRSTRAGRPASLVLVAARARAGRPRRRARAVLARPGRLALQRLDEPHRPARQRQHRQLARPPDRGRQRARPLLERGAEDRQGAQGARRRRRRLRDGPPALSHRHPRRAPRPRLRRADAGRPRRSSAWPSRSPCSPPGWRRPRARSGSGARRGARRGRPSASGMATLLAICVVFGVHSFVDWTWFVPGNAVLALLCAGWLAGRGPDRRADRAAHAAARGRARAVADRAGGGRRRRRRGGRLDVVAAPARGRRGLRRARHRRGAATSSRRARRSPHAERTNPLSVDLLFQQAAIERADGNTAGARGALQEAVRKRARQPGDVAGAGRVRAQRGPQAPGALGRRLGALPRPALAGGDHAPTCRPAAASRRPRTACSRARRAARAPTRSPRRRAPRAGCAR